MGKVYLFVIPLFLWFNVLLGQSTNADTLSTNLNDFEYKGDSTKLAYTSLKDSLKNELTPDVSLDSLKIKANKLDSATKDPFAINSTIQHRKDSLNQKTADIKGNLKRKTGLDSLELKARSFHDSVNPSAKVAEINKKLEAKQQKLTDSLQAKITKRKSSNKKDSITQATELKVNESVASIENKLADKDLPTYRLENNGLAENIPSLGSSNTNPLETNDKLQGVEGAHIDDPVEIDTPDLNEMKNQLEGDELDFGSDLNAELSSLKGEANLDEVASLKEEVSSPINEVKEEFSTPINDIKEEIGAPVDDLKNSKELGGVRNSTSEVKSISGEVGEYTQDTQKVLSGDEEEIQNNISKYGGNTEIDYVAQQRELIKNQKMIYEQQATMAREMQDMELFEEKLEEKLTEEKTNYLAGNEMAVAFAQKDLLSYKKKYKEIASTKDLENNKSEVLKRHGFIDKLFVGLDLELFRNETSSLDLIPFVGYKLFKRMELKASYSERIGFKNDEYDVQNNYIRSVRAYLNYDIFKGIGLSAGYEQFSFGNYDNLGIENSAKLIALGIQKKYKIVRSLYGNGQIYYNLLVEGKTPYVNRFNLRMGFFLDFKRD